MPYTRVMGIHVVDDNEYDKYRAGMTPILKSFGGAFGYDFKIAEVLISQSDGPINRVFTIDFPNKEIMETFFNDPAYLKVKAQHFDASVENRTIIALADNPL